MNTNRIDRRSRAFPWVAALACAVAPNVWAGITVGTSFSPAVIAAGGTSTLTIAIANNPPPGGTGSISFTDVYPANLVNAAVPAASSSCGGTIAAAAGGTSLSFSGGSVNGKQVCTVSVTVTSSLAGSYLNSTGTITTSNAGNAAPATATLTVTGASAAPSGFNAFETATAPGSVTGVIHTKISASAFNLAVAALKSGGAAVETAFSGTAKLELVDASAGAGCGAYGLIRNLGTLTFAAGDAGRKTLAGIVEPNAWPNARIRMSYPATGAPTIVACSTDNFAIRPASFGGVAASDADSTTAGSTRTLANTAVSGGYVHKAGQPFQIAATALNAAGIATSNYSGNPVASLTACVLPAAGCSLGTLATGAWSAAAGTVTTAGARYSEVGAVRMKLVDPGFAAVDAVDGSSAAERTIESADVNVGRFVPDHFDLTPISMPVFKTFDDTTCATRSFTYAGQPFGYLTLPQATITARNAAGATTRNYAGALWKLVPAGAVQSHTAANNLDIGLLGTPTVTANGGGTGSLAANPADRIAFVRSNPVAPFIANISLSMSIEDIAEASVSGNGIVAPASPALFSNIGFDAGKQIRFGQLVLSNAHGSELLNLSVPIEARYWDGSGFALNSADFCTRLDDANVALANWQRNLAPCETSVTMSGRFNAGRGTLRFSAPGAPNTGSVDLSVRLDAVGGGSACTGGIAAPATGAGQNWLGGRWNGPDYDDNPSARASFGLHRGSTPLIYLREIY